MAGAGYRVFTAGAVLTAAQVNTYLQEQSVMVFASAAARNAALASVLSEGQVAYLLDVNTLTVYSGAAWSTVGPVLGTWTAYTPTWSGTLGNGTIVGAYMRNGRQVSYRALVTWGTTTSHGAAIQTITLPVAAAGGYVAGHAIGTYTASNIATNTWSGTAVLGTVPSTVYGGGSVNLSGTAAAQPTNLVPFTWANTHILSFNGTYEASADA